LTSIKTSLKGKGMIGFVGKFSVNLRIPDYIGLGKSVSRGFGTVSHAQGQSTTCFNCFGDCRYDIHLRCDASTTIDRFQTTFVDTIRDHPEKRHLAVMNTVESSIDVFKHIRSKRTGRLKAIPKGHFFYLSTNITPRDRQERIRRIRESDGPVVIVSTQVIEAGVDISVDILHRDFAPFDCLVQSAGRCNRSNERPWRGEVYLWDLDPDEEGRRPYSHITTQDFKAMAAQSSNKAEADPP